MHQAESEQVSTQEMVGIINLLATLHLYQKQNDESLFSAINRYPDQMSKLFLIISKLDNFFEENQHVKIPEQNNIVGILTLLVHILLKEQKKLRLMALQKFNLRLCFPTSKDMTFQRVYQLFYQPGPHGLLNQAITAEALAGLCIATAEAGCLKAQKALIEYVTTAHLDLIGGIVQTLENTKIADDLKPQITDIIEKLTDLFIINFFKQKLATMPKQANEINKR